MARVVQRSRLASGRVDALRKVIRGQVVTPEDPDYEQARHVWNATADRRPAVIVRCTGIPDIVGALGFAREEDLIVAVRCGGHSVPGFSTCDDGIVIDLKPMKGVIVDPVARTATAQGGVTWGDFDRATQHFGLATTGGVVSTTGIAGLTLGGGRGWLMRKFGLACDNVRSMDLITAEGSFVRASADENGDLFWALRGGGGNFGIVTSIEYSLHTVGPTITGGRIIFSAADAASVLRAWRDFASGVPDELSMQTVLREVNGRAVCAIATCYAGGVDEGAKAVDPLRTLGTALVDALGPQPYVAQQTGIDAAFPPGQYHYTNSLAMADLTDEAIDVVVDGWATAPSPRPWALFEHLGGAVAAPPGGDTAYAQRAATYEVSLWGTWSEPARTEEYVAWSKQYIAAISPHARGDAYVNYLDIGQEDVVRAAYGERYARLQAIKDAYDPDNVFRLNQNIRPSRGV